MSKTQHEHQNEPKSSSADISQLATARSRPFQPRAKTTAEHTAEIRYLSAVAEAVEQVIAAVIIRLHMVSNSVSREALEHNRADLQRFKDELVSLQREHQRAIECLQAQE